MGGCYSKSYIDAFENIYPHILRMLSQWCFKYKRPIGVYETRVIDKMHKARWSIPFACPNTLPKIDVATVTMAETTLVSLISIFREGMNSQSYGNRFMNYYKILEAYPSYGPFQETNYSYKKKNISVPRSTPIVTKELLTGAYKEEYHQVFVGRKFTWCKEQLIEFRDALAHPFLREGYIDIDNINTQAQLSAYANLLERVAIVILEEEFKLWSEISDDANFKAVAQSYLQPNVI